MQESGCNRDATGARGEQGIMQVAGNACDPGDCKEPWYNIHKGAEILVSKMGGDPNGNIISALGQYNGWMPGMVSCLAVEGRARKQLSLPSISFSLARWSWCRVRSGGSKGFLPRRVSLMLGAVLVTKTVWLMSATPIQHAQQVVARKEQLLNDGLDLQARSLDQREF